jgi:translation initiation factor 2B subunit (eIF-2B alpha/beta/delta family)
VEFEEEEQNPATANALARLAADNRSGAAELLRQAEHVLATLQTDQDASTGTTRILSAAVAMTRAQPEMAPIANLASHILNILEANPGAASPVELARQAARDFCKAASSAATATIAHAFSTINDQAKVLIHSRSSTVLEVLRAARLAGRRFSVVATEGRPVLEGRSMAEDLIGCAESILFVVDAAAAFAMNDVDLVLFGADRVTPSYLVNKIGTEMIALAARERRVPVVAVCDTSKFINSASPIERPSTTRAGDEVWPSAPAGVRILNRYFEPVPIDYITAVITEHGRLSPSEAVSLARTKPLHPVIVEAIWAGSTD